MIRNLQRQDKWGSVKKRLMLSISRILKTQTHNSILLVALQTLIKIISVCSILFINNPLYPKQSNQTFKIFVLSHLVQLLNVDEKIILIVFVIFNFVLTILICINFLKSPFYYAVKTLGFSRPIVNILSVPIFYYTIENVGILLNSTNTQFTSYLLRILYIVSSIFVIGCTVLFTYFYIKPIRHSNILWNYTNNQEFVHHVFTLLRCFVVYLDKQTIIMLSISLIIELHIYQMQPSYFTQKVKLIFNAKHALCSIINFSLIVGYVSRNESLSFVTMVTTCIFYFFIKTMEFLSIYQSQMEIPKCCYENCKQMYSFAFQLKNKTKNTHDDMMRKLNLHFLACDSKNCIFGSQNLYNNSSQKITLDDLQLKITRFLKIYRYRSPESELMYEIWKIQLNKTINLEHNLRQFNIEHQFIVQYVLGTESSSKKQSVSSSSAPANSLNDSMSCKWKFYKQLENTVDEFEKMGDVLCKPLPGLTEVIDIVIGIHDQTEKLTVLFEEMVKNKDVNYVCIELYLKFFDCFLNKNKLSTDILDKLKRLKILIDSDYIQQNPFPCFIVDSATENIEKVNAQALKFLKIHRHELKDKTFNSLIMPSFSSKQIYAYSTKNKKEQLPIFFNIKSMNKTSMICRNIKIKTMQINNKNYYEMTVHKKNYGASIIDFLVNQALDVTAFTQPIIWIPYRQGSRQYKFEQFFNLKMKAMLKEISLLKVGRIQFEDECLVLGLVVEKFCPYPSMRLFTLNFIKKIVNNKSSRRLSQVRLTQLYQSSSEFSFYYKFDEYQNVFLEGCQCIKNNQDSFINENLQAHTLNEKLISFIANVTNARSSNYAAHIKVYRLYQGDLYNVDLEDREKYEVQFEGIQEAFESSKSWKFQVNQNYLIVFLILIALVITGCSLFLAVITDQSLDFVGSQQTKILFIQQFSLNYNRIMAILRDVASGIFDLLGGDYSVNVLDSYNELQRFDSSEFLSETVQIGVYSDEKYQGSLSQLIEVSLTHVYQFLQLDDHTIIQKIHDFALRYLGPLLSMEKQYKRDSIQQTTSKLENYSLYCFIFIISGAAVYFIMYIVISQQFKKNMNSFVEPFLLTSDFEAKRISEECEKFKNVISNLYKNYEADVDAIGQKRQKIKKRTRPKRTSFGLSSMLTELIVGGIVVLTLIGLALVQFTTIKNELSSLITLFKEGQAVMEVYSGLSWATNRIDHLGVIDFDEISKLNSYLDLIENHKSKYKFSTELSRDVKNVFFNNSCDYLVSKNIFDNVWCGDSMKGFTLKNPFRIGLDLYFRRINYNLVINVTDTFGSNGIYSEPFKKLFKYFSTNIREQIQLKLKQFRASLLVIAIMVTIMSFFLIIIFFVSLAYFKNKMRRVGKGLVDLVGDTLKKDQEENQTKKSMVKVKKTLSGHIDETDFLMATQEGADEVKQQV